MLTKGLKKERRWFVGYDIARRLPFVLIGYFTVQARPSLVLVRKDLRLFVCLYIVVLVYMYISNKDNLIIKKRTNNYRHYHLYT